MIAAAIVAAGCGRWGRAFSETSLSVTPGEGDIRRVVFAATPTETLTDAHVTFAVPDTCQVVAGAQESAFQELAAGSKVERALEIRCPSAAGAKLAVTVTAKRANGKDVTVGEETTLE